MSDKLVYIVAMYVIPTFVARRLPKKLRLAIHRKAVRAI